MLERVNQEMGKVLRGFGLVAGCLTFGVMLLVVANIIARFVFNAPIGGTLEVTESALTILIFLSLAMTQHEGGHIKVTLIMRRTSEKSIRIGNIVAAFLGSLFFAWATYAAWGLFVKSLMMNEQEWGSIIFPVYPVKFVIFLGLLLLSLQFLLDAFMFLRRPGQGDQR
jgi:TRAP-type C4-dicarboxylate transport system permease small subunit